MANISKKAMERGKARVLDALTVAGRPVKARNIAAIAGLWADHRQRSYSPMWANPYLRELVSDGKVIRVNYGRGHAVVYRLVQAVVDPAAPTVWDQDIPPGWVDTARQLRFDRTNNTVTLRSGTLSRLRALCELMVMPIEEVVDELVEEKVRTVFAGKGRGGAR